MAATRALRFLLPVLLLAGAGAGLALLIMTRPDGPAPEPRERFWVVETEPATLTSRSPQATLYGRVESPRTATLRAAITADVVAVHAREGERLETGEVLVRLDAEEVKLALDERRAEIRELEAQLAELAVQREAEQRALRLEESLAALAEQAVARQRDLLEEELGSQAALDEAQERHEQQRLAVSQRQRALAEIDTRQSQTEARKSRAQALLDRARLDLLRTEIRVPFGARIAAVSVAPGDRVQAGGAMAEVYDTEALEIRARLPSRHAAAAGEALSAGDRLQATGLVDDRELTLRLDRLAGRAPADSAGVDALFAVANAGDLPLGRFVEVLLPLPSADGVVAVPESAVYGMDRVYRLEDGRMRAVDVAVQGRVRLDGESRVLIAGPDLAEGDRIIVTRLPNAVDGLPVMEAGEDSAG